MGVETGLDFERLLALRARVAQWLAGEPTHGTIWKTGLPKPMKEALHA
jgi:hydroxymethylglutaryl-CoA lyase